MSKFYQPTNNSARRNELQIINLVFSAHDSLCSCTSPSEHIRHLLTREQCLHFKDAATTTETTGITENQDLTIEEGDLENLFSAENDVKEG